MSLTVVYRFGDVNDADLLDSEHILLVIDAEPFVFGKNEP